MRGLGGIAKELMSWAVDISDTVTFYRPPEVLTAEALLQHRAIIRWGDGETTLAMGRATAFQTKNARLAKELRALLRIHSPDVVICPPSALSRRCPFRGANRRYRRMWSVTAILLRYLSKQRVFGDAYIFRHESNFAGLKPLLARIEPARHVLIVSSNLEDRDILFAQMEKIGGTRPAITHIRVPKTNAYDVRGALLNQLRELKEAPDITLLSAGPVGKCLIPDLLSLWPASTQIIDTGHFFGHFRQQGDAQ